MMKPQAQQHARQWEVCVVIVFLNKVNIKVKKRDPLKVLVINII